MEVAVLIVFSGAQQGLAEFLGVPDQLQSGTSLIVGLLPFTVPTVKSTEAAGWRSVDAVIQSFTNQQDVLVPHEFPQQAMLYQAMSLLCFPKALLDFLNSSPSTRTYCIWPSPDQMLPGLDTIMLQYILESTKAMSAKVEEDVRVVFISNQHLETLHTMPSLVTKLANAPEIQFWMYGYSANMTCQSWQVQEVYPLGMRSCNIVCCCIVSNMSIRGCCNLHCFCTCRRFDWLLSAYVPDYRASLLGLLSCP